MKTRSLLLCVVLSFLRAVPALAEGSADLYVMFHSHDQAGEVFGFGARIGWNVTPSVTLDFAATLLDNGEVQSTGFDGDLGADPLEFGARYFIGDFYLGGGVTYWVFDDALEDIDADVGFYGLVGYKWVPDNWGWFIEATYRDGEAEIFDITIDVSGPGARAGVTFNW